MHYWRENIRAVQEVAPALAESLAVAAGDVEVVAAESGWPTARCGCEGKRIFLHSSLDPWREAELLVERADVDGADVVIVLGAGLGYHLLALRERVPAARMVVVERDPAVLRKALEVLDLAPLWREGESAWVVGDGVDQVGGVLDRVFDCYRLKKVAVVEHPASVRRYPEYYRAVRRRVRDALNNALLNLVTIMSHGGDWMRNAILNLPAVLASPGIVELFGKFSGRPAIIISAGPSLDKNVDLLAEAKGRALLLCVDTALKAVLKRGIRPDMVFSIDGSLLNYRHFEGVAVDDVWLVAEPMTHHRILEEFRGPKMVMSFGSPLMRWLERFAGPKGYLPAGGSVATAAFSAAVRMGADPVIFVGQDLAYPAGRFYASGTFYADNGWRFDVDPRHLIPVPAVDGGEVLTPRNLYNFLRWFEAAIRQTPGVTFVDATEGGALIAGTRVMTLREALDAYCREPVPVAETLAQVARPDPDWSGFIRELGRLKREFGRVARLARDGELLSRRLRAAASGPGRSHAVAELLKRLDEIDGRLLRRRETVSMVEQVCQAVLFPVVRGMELAEGDKLSEAWVAEQCQSLYAAVAAAAGHLQGLVDQAVGRVHALAGGVPA